MPQLDGRVFSRQQQYDALPTELKDEVSALVDYLTTNQHDVFGFHHANLLKSVRSVRAKPLTEKITAWLLHKELATSETVVDASETVVDTETKIEETPAATEEIKPAEEDKPAEDKPAEATETPAADAAPAPTAEEAAKAKEDAKAAALQAKEEAAAKTKAEQEAQAARLAHAKKLLEALVLKGFVTPYKESEKILTTPLTGPETFTFKDSELFVPLAAEVAAEPVAAPAAASTPPQEASASVDQSASVEQSDAKPAEENATPAPATPPTTPAPLPTTVWDLVDGAVFAAVLKRKAGFLAPLTQGKDTYVVVNARSRSLTLFESDLGRQPIVEFGYEGTTAAFDKPHFVHGVKIWNDTITELLNANTKLEREALVHSLLGIGITYHEDLAPGLDKLETIYSLKDTDIDGQEITFDKYKGKVLLIVNVSSKCGLTPTNYPELVTLYDKYHEQGLEVLAFPCNQFMGQEPGTHDEIKAFVAQYNASFPFFSKGDVNGVDARPVFAYLKHKLPGPYIQWNFAKFLVDRNGVPVKRFGPQELPLSFEGEIVKLLAEEAKPEVVETPATTETTEVVAEAAVATTEAEAAPAVEAAVEAPPAAVEETKAPAPAPAEPTPAPVEEDKAAEPTPEAAPVEETAAPADPVKPAPAPVTPEAPAVVETKVETPAAVEAPAPAVEQKIEAVAAAPPAPSEEPTPALKQAPASDTNQHEADVPAQGFTPGNEPTSAP